MNRMNIRGLHGDNFSSLLLVALALLTSRVRYIQGFDAAIESEKDSRK